MYTVLLCLFIFEVHLMGEHDMYFVDNSDLERQT